MSGNVSKMKIISYADPKNKKGKEEVTVMVNPESYNQKIEIKYSEKQAPGTAGKMPKFTKIEPDKIDFELFFDRTGVLSALPVGDIGVDEDINALKKVAVEYKGEQHRPRLLSIYWGTLKFDGCLETMDVSYKLFDADGRPLRALVKVAFTGFIEDDKRLAIQDDQSPDITHIRKAKHGDSLPLMCYDIYGDAGYYAAVAQANRLTDFRNLPEGLEITFPPLDK